METAPLRERREDIPAMIAYYLREAAAVTNRINQCEPYWIEEDAAALLCQFDYPGNIRALRNLIYELTSYVEESEPISIELVQFVLAKLNSRGGNPVTSSKRQTSPSFPGSQITAAGNTDYMDAIAQQSLLRSMADEGDIILPLELCVLRRAETFKQWTARAKRCSIQAARLATGGSLQSAAERLGLTRSSLQAHLHRARHAQNEALFDWQQDPDRDSSEQ
jgi:DNA-binding NtrC family response regulator